MININSFEFLVNFLNVKDLTKQEGLKNLINFELRVSDSSLGLILRLKKPFFRELMQNLTPNILIRN